MPIPRANDPSDPSDFTPVPPPVPAFPPPTRYRPNRPYSERVAIYGFTHAVKGGAILGIAYCIVIFAKVLFC